MKNRNLVLLLLRKFHIPRKLVLLLFFLSLAFLALVVLVLGFILMFVFHHGKPAAITFAAMLRG